MAAQDWTTCIAFTLAAEGGLVDDPRDPGGLTNFGISQAAYPNVDIRALTPAKASVIYHTDYWEPLCADSPNLQPGVDLMVFDMGVNAGDGRSARILQRCLGFDGVSPGQEIDGAIGPHTLLAVKGADPRKLVADLEAAQLAFYRSLPKWAAFGAGWTKRVDDRAAHARAMLAGSNLPPPPQPTWLGQIEGWAARFL